MPKPKNRPPELVQGTLDMLVLKALTRESLHGYAVAEWIRATSRDVLRVQEGALYPALHRLELAGMLTSEWAVSDKGRRAKYYSLTAAGRKQLQAERAQFEKVLGAIVRVIEA